MPLPVTWSMVFVLFAKIIDHRQLSHALFKLIVIHARKVQRAL